MVAARRRSAEAPEPGSAPGDAARCRRGPRHRRRSAMLDAAGGRLLARPWSWRSTSPESAPPPECSARARSCELLAAERAGAVVAIHRPLDAGCQRQLQGAGDSVDDSRNALGFGFRETPEDVVPPRLRTLSRRLADADPEAHEVRGAQRADQRQDPVVPRSRAPASDSHAAKGQVELVIDDPDVLRRYV